MLTEMERALITLTREHWREDARRHEAQTQRLDELTKRLDALTSMFAGLERLLNEEFHK